MKKVFANQDFCIGCKLCEVHCRASHSKYPKDIVKAFTKDQNLPLPRVIVEENQPLSFALQCRHCEDPACTKACITGAMQKDPKTGVVFNQEDRCVGCWTCILVCPFGVIKRDERGHKVASKCDLCADSDLGPACVRNCPNGALILGEEA